MELKCKIKGRTYNVTVGATFSEEYNETLDSGTIIIPQTRKIDLNPYDDVYIWNADENFDGYYNKGDAIPSGTAQSNSTLPTFFKHLLVDSYKAEMIGLDGKYNYTISLMSETKGLDVVSCPNISITQSLKDEEKRTCYFYLNQFINLYSPKIKVKNPTSNTWTYKQKYKIDPNDDTVTGSVANIFKNVICPEMSFTNPTLREVLSQIMTVCDCIPVVKNGVIYAMDISKTNGTFVTDSSHTNYIHEGANSGDFSTAARREYGGALSQTTTQCVEYLGFRNKEDALLTIENMYLETRFPIYKINKLTLCYYKYAIMGLGQGQTAERPFLCEHDITDLVLQNNVRNALSADWSTYPQQINQRSDMNKYKILTVGYDIGSNKITGWGTKYQYFTFAWFQSTKTYLENILDLLETFNIYGDYMSFAQMAIRQTKYEAITTNAWSHSTKGMVSPLTGSARLKTIFFKIEYEAMYDGAIIHGKENASRDDIITVDNQTSALTITEKDGLFEYSKLKRLGNRNLQIQCRYDSVSQMNTTYNNVLGAIYKNNIIIFHKEYQIYDSFVLCNFVGTYSYVLKNYFTSVFAKLRMYNYMSYGESIKRAENIKKYLLLSLDSLYYEQSSDFLIDRKSLLTATSETKFNYNLLRFENDYELNTGYFVVNNNKYLSDMQRLISGYSLCFNVKMYDNIAGGLYIKHWQATYDTSDPKDITPYSEYDTIENDGTRKATTLQGSNQDWYIMPQSLTDAFIQNISIFIGINNNIKDLKFTNPATSSDTLNNYTNIIDILPKTTGNITNAIGSTYNVCKDNKELIDATFQIELLNKNVLNLEKNNPEGSIVVSNWFMKLCDLYGNYIKSSDDKNYIDYAAPYGVSTTMIFGWWDQFIQMERQVIVLRIKENLIQDYVKAEYVFYVPDTLKSTVAFFGHDGSHESAYYRLFIYPLSIVQVSNDKQSITVKFSFKVYKEQHSSLVFKREYILDVPMAKDSESLKDYYDYKFSGKFSQLGGSLSNANLLNQRWAVKEPDTPVSENQDFYWKQLNGFPEHSKNANITNSLFFEGIHLNSGSGNEFIVEKARNMFISTSSNSINNNIIQKTFSSSNFSESGCTLRTNISALDALSILDNHTIRIYLNQFDSTVNSVQYWFYDDTGDKLYHFVLGVNLTSEMKAKGYVDIYASLVSSKDERVFDYLNNENYRIKNYISSSDYGTSQQCVQFIDIVDGIEYTKVGESLVMNDLYYSKINDTEEFKVTSYYVL